MTGSEWIAVVRIAAAVYEALEPTLEEIQTDIRSLKSDLASLTQRVDNLTEGALQTVLESKNASVNDSVVDIMISALASINNSMRDDIKCVKTELSRVNEIVSNLCGDIHSHSLQTAAAAAELETRLSFMNESMRDDFSEIKTKLSYISDTEENRTCNTTEIQETHPTTQPMTINNTMTVNSSNCGGKDWR